MAHIKLLTTSSMLKKIASKANSARNISLIPSSHPALPIKFFPNAITHNQRRFYYGARRSNVDAISNNVCRLYARRVLEIASMSAATMAATTQMEAQIMKPSEWDTEDLILKRKDFGESISCLGKTRVERVFAAGRRILNLTLLASPLIILAPLASISSKGSRINDCAWNYAVWSVEKAGPTFIKLTQWATTRNDLFSPEFVNKFSKLQDNTRGHSWNDTVKQLKKSLGSHYEDIFEFDDSVVKGTKQRSLKEKYSPIGSGCVAQVYKAKLKQPVSGLPAGHDVAIKVTHPNILHKVCVDFYILHRIVGAIEKIPYLNLDYLSLKDSVGQFRDIMLPQLDLRVEASNLKRFRRDFADDARVSFPAPVDELTTQNVLVESYIHGMTVPEFGKEHNSSKAEREDLAVVGFQTVMKMIFLHDFIHGDLHPGNILINRNTTVRGNPIQMNLIDCGLVVEMGRVEHANLVQILGSLVKLDGKKAGALMVDTAKKCQASTLDVKLFCAGMQKICEDDSDNNFLESVGDYLSDICYLACRHKVKLEASFINAALACEIMEGVACKLYPGMDVQQYALPMVFKAEVMHGFKDMTSRVENFTFG